MESRTTNNTGKPARFSSFWERIGLAGGLILFNIIVYLIVLLAGGILELAGYPPHTAQNAIDLSSSPLQLTRYPWSLLAYGFMHTGILHLLFNSIAIWLGGIIYERFLPPYLFISTYVGGILGGGIWFLLLANIFNLEPVSIAGASAGIYSLFAALFLVIPQYEVSFGGIRIRAWVVSAVVMLFCLLGFLDFENLGGSFAHLGGVGTGLLLGYYYKRGIIDRSKDLVIECDRDENGEPECTAVVIDDILDKISLSGYDSLTRAEKHFFIEYTKRK